MTQASEFYARSQGVQCIGDHVCHYCEAPCGTLWLHKEPAPVPFSRQPVTARKPESPWMCLACWLWHRKRVTVFNLSGGFKDGQCPLHHSWVMTESQAVVISGVCQEAAYDFLLAPPLRFCVSLLEGSHPPDNLLQTQLFNDCDEIKADTELHFTINNIKHSYTIHELEETLINGELGRMPGARALYRVLGPLAKMQADKTVQRQKLKRGRPTVEQSKILHHDPRIGKQDRVVTPGPDTPKQKEPKQDVEVRPDIEVETKSAKPELKKAG